MGDREKLMFERLDPKTHESAKIILATFRSIKEECKERRCVDCRYYEERTAYYAPCLFTGDRDFNPEDWNEYEIVERICK